MEVCVRSGENLEEGRKVCRKDSISCGLLAGARKVDLALLAFGLEICS
jgi:hypothetical protein